MSSLSFILSIIFYFCNVRYMRHSFKSKECKKEKHFVCSHRWEGFGFEVSCNCECYRKQSSGKNIIHPDISNENTITTEYGQYR